MSARSLLAEHREREARAGALAHQVPWWGWVTDRVLLTRQGELMALAEFRPRSRTATSSRSQDAVIGQWARMLNALPVGGRCQLIFLRTPMGRLPSPTSGSPLAREVQSARQRWIERNCYRSRCWVCWVLQPDWLSDESTMGFVGQVRNILGLSSARRIRSLRESELARSVDEFTHRVDSLADMVSEATPCRMLEREAATGVLSEMLNGPGWQVPSARPGLYWQIARAPVEIYRRSLAVDGREARMFSLQTPPGECWRDMLPDAWELPCETSMVWSYRQLGLPAVRKKLHSLAKAYNRRRFSAMAAARGIEGTATTMEDTGAARDTEELQEALANLQRGILFGEMSMVFGLHGSEGETHAAESILQRTFAGVDGKLVSETIGSAPVYFGRLPGQLHQRMPRTCLVSSPAAACMAPLFGSSQGHARCNHLSSEFPLTIFQTRQKSPFFYDLFGGSDVGHTLILGATGSGKSFLLNFLLLSALKYEPSIAVLDLGGSYEAITALVGGSLVRIGQDSEMRLSPFSLPHTLETAQFLTAFTCRLLRHGGVPPTGAEATDISDRVREIYQLPREVRRLSELRDLLEPRLKPGLDMWCEPGLWGHIFDHPPGEEDTSLAEWQVVDLAGCANFPELADAALHFFLERFRLHMDDPSRIGQLKILVVDEAWRFLMDPETGTYIGEAAKTWRKKNGALWVATQSPEDVLSDGRAPPLLDSLANRLYLANAEMPQEASESLHLSEEEIDLIRSVQPKREIYLRRRDEREVLQLRVDRRAYWLYTSNPVEVARRARAVRRLGLSAALDHLAASSGR